jgi:hypothetical protein
MRIVGPYPDRTEFEPDPAKAYRRGRALDALLRSALPRPERGVRRGTFADFARADEARMREAARRLNEA